MNSPLHRRTFLHLASALGCFVLACALVWWGPMGKLGVEGIFLLIVVGGVFFAFFLQTLPSPYRQITLSVLVVLAVWLLGSLLLPCM